MLLLSLLTMIHNYENWILQPTKHFWVLVVVLSKSICLNTKQCPTVNSKLPVTGPSNTFQRSEQNPTEAELDPSLVTMPPFQPTLPPSWATRLV